MTKGHCCDCENDECEPRWRCKKCTDEYTKFSHIRPISVVHIDTEECCITGNSNEVSFLEHSSGKDIRVDWKELSKLVFKYLSILIIFFSVSSSAFAEIPTPLAVRAIIGEASGEGYHGMLAVAEALRNRGHLKGVYGVKAKHISKESLQVWKSAEKAWNASKHSNLTHGASLWGNSDDVKIFKKTAWFKNCKQTAKIGGHYFFRESGR